MLMSGYQRRVSVMGCATGAVVGMVAITPACGYVEVLPALLIGVIAAIVSYKCMELRHTLKFDDTLDVWACHGMAGTWGALATGLFATKAVNPAGADGWFYGNPDLFWTQLISVVVAWVWAFGMTYFLCKGLEALRGLSVKTQEEQVGLDISQHGEEALVAI
jgi:Amt family ammonium transporter